MLKTAFLIRFCATLLIASCFVNCSGGKQDEYASDGDIELTEEEEKMYLDVEMPVTVKKSGSWQGNQKIRAKAEVKMMQLSFVVKIADIPQSIIPLSADKRDTFPNTEFNISFTQNNQPLTIKMSPQKHSWFYRNGFSETSSLLDRSSGIKQIGKDKYIEVNVPLFAFSEYPANKKITIDVHVWQDYFFTNEKAVRDRETTFDNYVRDTLRSKLIDNVYSFTLTVPEIHQSDIMCDSIVLQNDKEWSPAGSDNTLWKSSLPDIYFSISDMYGTMQGSSDVEKSTSIYTIGDTVPYYHYKERERFYIQVYDWDMLSKNDELGFWKGYVNKFVSGQNYNLKFGHVDRFAFRRKYYGKIN